MSTRRATTVIPATPELVLDALLSPDACRAWCPVPVEVADAGDRLAAGDVALVRGTLAGKALEFTVEVLEAAEERFALLARGPFEIEAIYRLEDDGDGGTAVQAEVRTGRPRGLGGRILATACDGLLGAGFLEAALGRIRDHIAHGICVAHA